MSAGPRTLGDARRPALHDHARAIILLVAISILAGIALRLSGFVGGAYSWFGLSGAQDDSWMPMGLAYARALGLSPGSPRDLILVDNVKFQYPPTSLLLYAGFDLLGIAPTVRAMNVMVWLSILATPALVFGICIKYLATQRSAVGFSRTEEYLVAAALALATLFFYPIMISWRLGQVQGLLNMLFAAACLSWLANRKVLAGCLIGAACLIKPQFSLFLVWAVLRREHAFALGQALTFGIGFLISIGLFGWRPHLEYLEVLAFISRHGENFWDNTSVNGLFNRFFHPDQTLIFEYGGWPRYEWPVYLATLVSSLGIVAFALFVVGRRDGRGSILDFMAAAFCFTLAAPVAWGHHFGVAMPILAVLLIGIGGLPERQRRVLLPLAAICFLAFSNNWNVSDLLAGTPFTILQSWRLFAAFVLLWLLYQVTASRPATMGRAGNFASGPTTLAAMGPVAAGTQQS